MGRQKKYAEEDVIAKATEAFWKHGYERTSVRDLEREMGINQFSIYSSFGSKKGVFLKALEHYESEVEHIFLSDLIHSEGDVADIEKFFNSFVQSVQSGKTPNGCLMANTAMSVEQKDTDVREQLNRFFDLLHDVFIGVLQKAQRRGKVPEHANTERLANYLVGCTEGLAVTAKVLDKKKLEDFIAVTLQSLQ